MQRMLAAIMGLLLLGCGGGGKPATSGGAGQQGTAGIPADAQAPIDAPSSIDVVEARPDGPTRESGSAAGSGDAEVGEAGSSDGAAGATADPCGSALFCEHFDSYPSVTTIADKQKLGPWHAALNTGATMVLDGAHTTSGATALHVHIDDAVTAGGRLFADGAQPIFAGAPTHVYGRMMMYIDPNGTSVHWTFFGVNGNAEASSPAVGRSASYIMSSLPKNGVNTYSFVYGLSAMGTDAYHDCSSQSATPMPSTWACVSFEMDSVARKLRMYKDGAAAPILSIDDHGKGCVAPTSVTSPWYGPAMSQLFVGAWSFHAMTAPLDVWIDDLVVDTKPVACPSP
jgi:hypothetical protein